MNKATTLFFILLIAVSFAFQSQDNALYRTNAGVVSFLSSAPHEKIKATSKKLYGVLDPNKRMYNFAVPISSFEGFNSPLQKEHFNENYLESQKNPKAYYKGKIIEEVDLKKPGIYQVRAKGMLTIHGIEKECIVKSKVVSEGNKLNIESNFSVLLKDYGIKIPKVVSQKIAEEIAVTINVDMVIKN
ncbi:MAG TPA: YceI family protein [Bacteroidia bacterium]|nr:YceI family protein [Bacteroidia bacterium]